IDDAAAGHTFRLVIVALIAEVARIHRIFVIKSVVQSNSTRILINSLAGIQLDDVEIGVGRSALKGNGSGASEGSYQRANGRHSASRCRCTRNRFDKIDASAQAIPFIAGKEEEFIFNDRTADGAAKLVQTQGRNVLKVEEVAGVEGIIA